MTAFNTFGEIVDLAAADKRDPLAECPACNHLGKTCFRHQFWERFPSIQTLMMREAQKGNLPQRVLEAALQIKELVEATRFKEAVKALNKLEPQVYKLQVSRNLERCGYRGRDLPVRAMPIYREVMEFFNKGLYAEARLRMRDLQPFIPQVQPEVGVATRPRMKAKDRRAQNKSQRREGIKKNLARLGLY